jgi:hypothetical protein
MMGNNVGPAESGKFGVGLAVWIIKKSCTLLSGDRLGEKVISDGSV